jgi:hypothetical protein
MKTTPFARVARCVARPAVLGALGVLAVAAWLYSRFDLHGRMIRDSAIYIYGGQQVLHGRQPYVSEMDPKGPISSILASFGVGVAKLFGGSDVLTVRAEFCAIAVIGVLGIYLLVHELCGSVVAAVIAAVVFAAFRNFGYNALVQTDGHIPGIVFMIFAMWLILRKQWYLAGGVASLAFLTWQPLGVVPLMAAICAVAWSPGRRLRALGRTALGGATPVVVLACYYAVGWHLKNLVQGLLIYPLTGVQRLPNTAGRRLMAMIRAMPSLYGYAAVLFWIGIAVLLLAAAWTVASAGPRWRGALLSPLVLLFTLSLLFQLAYVLYDYIGYPHTWPLLPYAAVGIGVGTAALLDVLSAPYLRAAQAVMLSVATALAVFSAVKYADMPSGSADLGSQQAAACALNHSLAPNTPLWTIDDPVPLVLLHRRQPDDYPYVGGGLDIWKANHTRGGFHGWMGQIERSRASIVVVDAWVFGRYKEPVQIWLLEHGFRKGFIGPWKVFVDPAARRQMRALSIKLASRRRDWALTPSGRMITLARCQSLRPS